MRQLPQAGRHHAGRAYEGRADPMFEMTLVQLIFDLFWWLKR